MKRKITVRKPADWQLDPRSIETSNVQYWRNGLMVTGEVKKDKAMELVASGVAFVMTPSSIGALVDGVMQS